MNRKKHRPLAERAVEAVAALTLGAAVGFGAFQLTPLAGAALWSVASVGAVASAFEWRITTRRCCDAAMEAA